MATRTKTVLLGIDEVRQRIPVSRVTIWRWVAKGKFPRPLKVSEQRSMWRESDVEAWIAKRPQVGPHGKLIDAAE